MLYLNIFTNYYSWIKFRLQYCYGINIGQFISWAAITLLFNLEYYFMVKKKCAVILHFLFLFSSGKMLSQPIFTSPDNDQIIDCFSISNRDIILTEHTIFITNKGIIRHSHRISERIIDGIMTNSKFWFCTESGIYKSSIKKDKLIDIQKINFPLSDYSSVKLKTELSNHENVWVFTRDEGIYKSVGDSVFSLLLKANMLNDLFVVSGDDYWMATDAGLLHKVGGNIFKYSEEGVAGFEVPDNIVDNLYGDVDHLMAKMSSTISLLKLEGENTESHGKTISYIGEKGNSIYHACFLSNGSVLFATQMGLICLSKDSFTHEAEDDIFHEVFQASENSAARLLNSSILPSKSIRIYKIRQLTRNKLYLIGEKTIYRMPLNKLL